MNEQLKQLAEQAEEYTRLKHNNAYWRLLDDMQEDLTWREKFAELIVAEMLQTCEDHPAWTGRMIGEQIKQYFGVEE